MAGVPVRELNHDTAGVLARVKSGEPVDITERGIVVARLIPVGDHPLAELCRSGKLRPATVSGPAPRPSGPVHTDRESGVVLRDMRDVERY